MTDRHENNFDPYEVLEIDRGASDEEIEAAFRRAAKVAHPDTPTGNNEWFARILLARNILLEPERRRRFDEEGRAEQDRSNNDRSHALQAIEQQIEKLMPTLMSSIEHGEPISAREWLDEIVYGIEEAIERNADAAKAGNKMAKKIRAFSACLLSRDPENPIARLVTRRAETIERHVESMEDARRGMRLALEMLAGYSVKEKKKADDADLVEEIGELIGHFKIEK